MFLKRLDFLKTLVFFIRIFFLKRLDFLKRLFFPKRLFFLKRLFFVKCFRISSNGLCFSKDFCFPGTYCFPQKAYFSSKDCKCSQMSSNGPYDTKFCKVDFKLMLYSAFKSKISFENLLTFGKINLTPKSCATAPLGIDILKSCLATQCAM